MLRPFPEFTTYPTHHCVTGLLKHIYDYHGYPVSEDLLLGLGRGLGFVYFHIKGTDPFYGGRANMARPERRAWRRPLAGAPESQPCRMPLRAPARPKTRCGRCWRLVSR